MVPVRIRQSELSTFKQQLGDKNRFLLLHLRINKLLFEFAPKLQSASLK